MVFFAFPKNLTSVAPNEINAFKANLVTNNAVNIDNKTPINNVFAKLATVPEPSNNKITEAIIVVILPSTIADNALSKPFFMEVSKLLPSASSSLIRVNIITFASTAIPMESKIPAIPGKVNVTLKQFSVKLIAPT